MPNAVGEEFTREGDAEEGDYVLAVGTLEPRKNLARLVEAVRKTGRELRVVGARGWGGVDVGGNGVRWLGEVDDTELAAALSRRNVCRVPLAVRGLRDSGLGGDGVRHAGGHDARRLRWKRWPTAQPSLVDAQSPEDIAAGIERAASERDELVARGVERARAFRWDAVADATVRVYEEAAS